MVVVGISQTDSFQAAKFFKIPRSTHSFQFPPLYIASDEGVFRTTYVESSGLYTTNERVSDTRDVVKLFATQDALFIIMPEKIERRHYDGTLVAVWERSSSPTFQVLTHEEEIKGFQEYEQLKAAVYESGKLYVAANRSLIVLDEQLRELGNITPLDRKYKEKAIDDILIQGDIAFLIDDVTFPSFVFSVDVHNPSQLALLRTIGVGGVNGTVTNQWYGNTSENWCFQQSQGGGGWSEAKLVCATPSLYKKAGATNPYGYLREAEGLSVREISSERWWLAKIGNRTGIKVMKELDRSDDWMLIEDVKSQKNFLVRLNEEFAISNKRLLGQSLARSSNTLYRFKQHLFFYTHDQFIVFEENGNNLIEVLRQTIPEKEIRGYIFPYNKRPTWSTFVADPR